MQEQPPSAPNNDARTWATLVHVASFTGYITAIGFFAGPLVIWLIKREEHLLVEDQGKEAMNFNLSLAIYIIAAGVVALTGIGLLIAIPVWIAVAICHLIFTIIAASTANRGEPYRYPLTIRMIG